MAARASRTVLITGASGQLGRILTRGLSEAYPVRGVDRRRDRRSGVRRVDLRSLLLTRRALAGVDTVVDLAATPQATAPWGRVYRNNVRATMNVLRAAHSAGVRRVVFASSNHVTGLYERDEPYASIVAGAYDGIDPDAIPRLDGDVPLRPDGPYAVGKAFGEAAARFYAEEHGVSVICLRIGSVTPSGTPTTPRSFATLLTHGDLVRLVRASIDAPEAVRFAVYYGVSANRWRIWDIEAPRRAIGYTPRDDAERWRS